MNHQRFLWQVFLSVLVGMALLVFVGLSLVFVLFRTGSPVAQFLPDEEPWDDPDFLFGTLGLMSKIRGECEIFV